MSFDTSTLYLFATMVAGMLGAMLVFFGRQENIPALKWWGTAYLLGAASVALWTVGGSKLGEPLSLALNAVGFVACGMVWNAVARVPRPQTQSAGTGVRRDCLGRRRRDAAAGDAALRLTIGAAIVAIYAALTAAELWNERRRVPCRSAGRRSSSRCCTAAC